MRSCLLASHPPSFLPFVSVFALLICCIGAGKEKPAHPMASLDNSHRRKQGHMPREGRACIWNQGPSDFGSYYMTQTRRAHATAPRPLEEQEFEWPILGTRRRSVLVLWVCLCLVQVHRFWSLAELAHLVIEKERSIVGGRERRLKKCDASST